MSKKLIVGLLKADYTDRNLRAKIKSYVERLDDLGLDVFVASEFAFFGSETPRSEPEYNQGVEELAEKTKGKRALVLAGTGARYDGEGKLRNTLPVICDGKVILEYDKKEGWTEYDIAKHFGKEFREGMRSGVFKWDAPNGYRSKLKAGVEICYDHHCGTLKKELKERDLDLQFIVATGMDIDNNKLAVRDGGYAILCDGLSDALTSPTVEVQRLAKNGKPEKLDPTTVVNDELFIYELTLDAETPSG